MMRTEEIAIDEPDVLESRTTSGAIHANSSWKTQREMEKRMRVSCVDDQGGGNFEVSEGSRMKYYPRGLRGGLGWTRRTRLLFAATITRRIQLARIFPKSVANNDFPYHYS